MKTTYDCVTCGKPVTRTPATVVGRVFCSRPCTHAANRGQPSRRRQMTGSNHAQWKGGVIIHDGYRFLFQPEHPNADKRGYVGEHRVVMSEKLGRALTPAEHVHHRNHDRSDNRPENLEVLSASAHIHQHRLEESGRWARDWEHCTDCGTTEHRHYGRGYCIRCFHRHWQSAHRRALGLPTRG